MLHHILHAVAPFFGRGGGLALIALIGWQGTCWLTDYGPDDIPPQYR